MANSPKLTLAYTLTPADAQAWERVPRELKGWPFITLLAWVGSIGGLAGFLPESMVGPMLGAGFFAATALLGAAAWGIAILARRLAGEIRAKRRVGADMQVKLRLWDDRMGIYAEGEERIIPYAKVSGVTRTDGHVFISSGNDLVIVPATAFKSEAKSKAFASEIERLSRR